MTVRWLAPTTAIGLPLSSGLACCSTEAKKAFISRWIMERCIGAIVWSVYSACRFNSSQFCLVVL